VILSFVRPVPHPVGFWLTKEQVSNLPRSRAKYLKTGPGTKQRYQFDDLSLLPASGAVTSSFGGQRCCDAFSEMRSVPLPVCSTREVITISE
jgi:hypothetical protein